jgi:hypothetical protein
MNDPTSQGTGAPPKEPSATVPRLADVLMKIQLRESGGTVGADRYDYQKNWTLCKILDLHSKGINYVVLCEFHEDVTVLNDTVDPSKVTFYQIKTDEKKNWTVQRLIARKKGAGESRLPSILGNLCGKSSELAGCDAEFRFASNAKYSIQSMTGASLEESHVFLCLEINDADRVKLKTALTDELGSVLPTSFDHVLGFEVADLALPSHSDLTTGKLAKFLDEYAAGCAVHTATFYRALFDEVRRRTTARWPKTTLGDVCGMKGISRVQFDGMLGDAIRATPVDHTWTLIQQELIIAATPLAQRLELQEASRKYFIRRLNPNDTALQRFRRRALKVAQSVMDEAPDVALLALAEAVLKALWPSEEILAAQLSQTEVKALVMVELYERRESEVPAPGSKPSQEQP